LDVRANDLLPEHFEVSQILTSCAGSQKNPYKGYTKQQLLSWKQSGFSKVESDKCGQQRTGNPRRTQEASKAIRMQIQSSRNRLLIGSKMSRSDRKMC